MSHKIHSSCTDEQASVWKPDLFEDPVHVDVRQLAITVEELATRDLGTGSKIPRRKCEHDGLQQPLRTRDSGFGHLS